MMLVEATGTRCRTVMARTELSMELLQNNLEQDFEKAWNRDRRKLRSIVVASGSDINNIDDFLQDTAVRVWRTCVKQKSIPDNFISHSASVSRRIVRDSLRMEMRGPKIELQPSKFFEQYAPRFADLWGRVVPSTRWGFAEEYSTNPLDWSARLGRVEEMIGKNNPVLYYLSIGASVREIAKLSGLHVSSLVKRLTQITNLLESEGAVSVPGPQFFSWGHLSESPPLAQLSFFEWRPTEPNAPTHLRTLPGYLPEWITWFIRLSEYLSPGSEPITFGLIRRIADQDPNLKEEQGRRFLIAAASDDGDLLSQKFIQIQPNAEHKSLSFSDIYQILRGEGAQDWPHSYSNVEEWMDQIVTFWDPTSKWLDLKPW